MKKFIVRIPNELNTRYLEEFLETELNMGFCESGMVDVQFCSDLKPRKFQEKILKNFGTGVWNNIKFGREKF